MRYIWLLVLSGFFFISVSVNAQEWVEMMEDPSANFYDTQQSFNNYWDGKEIERGKGWKQFKRWEYFMEQRVFPNGVIPAPNQVANAYQQYIEALDNFGETGGNNSDWSSLGPSSWQAIGWNPGIGRVNCTAVDPFDSNTVYIGAPAGGFWVSYDRGGSWETTTDDLTVLGVTSIVIHPQNSNVIYIGTGDGDAGDTYSIGVLKSVDGGFNWSPTGLNWNVTQTRRISKILIHPETPDIMLAATNNGVYKSTDAGDNWTLTRSGNFKDIEFKPGDPSIVYVAGTSFLRSTDTGSTFTGASGIPSSGVNRYALAVTPANPDYVYALAGASSNSGFFGLYRSTNSGAQFTRQSNSPNLMGWAVDGNDSGGQSWYDLSIAASPVDPEVIYTGGVNIWKSVNGGSNWSIATHWNYNTSSVPYAHADIHSLDYHGNTLFAGTDGGCWITDNDGGDWTDISAGLVISQFYRIGGYPGDAGLLIGGTQDNGTNRLADGQWTHVLGADGMEAAIDYSDPNIMYGCIQGGALQRSFDGGNSFDDIAPANGAWVTPYQIDPHNPEILYGAYTSLYKSTNRGTSWAPISPSFGSLNSLAVSPTDPNYIYTSDNSNLFRTTDGGENWDLISGAVPNLYITYTAVSNHDPRHVWITLSGYTAGQKVYRSTDAGATWENISGSLPNLPANCVVHHRDGYDAVYVGTDVGIYYRNATMSDWEPYFTNLPNVIVQELEIHYASNTIKAATFGRGIWESPLGPSSASISHTQLGNTDDLDGPYEVTATIIPGEANLNLDNLFLFYGTGGVLDNFTAMTPTGNPHEYSGSIPAQGSDIFVEYYISTEDNNGYVRNLPYSAPESFFSFYVGIDDTPPAISHETFPFVEFSELPAHISTSATDLFGIDTVWVEYSVNNGPLMTFGLSGENENYSGTFPFDTTSININDDVEYTIYAQDASSAGNQALDGPHNFYIRQTLSTLNQGIIRVIPDNDPIGYSDTLTVVDPENYYVRELKFYISNVHNNIGDLIFKLTAPNGEQITLMDRPGYPASATGSPGNGPRIFLEDNAEVSIETVEVGNTTTLTGTYRPDPDLLSTFNGVSYGGEWVLNISDHNQGILGVIQEWGIYAAVTTTTSIDDREIVEVPRQYHLFQNYPNPFNPETTIRYDLPAAGTVSLTIYNVLGQQVRQLVNANQAGGSYSVVWDGQNAFGTKAASGIYFYRLVVENATNGEQFNQMHKMLLLK